MLKHMLMQNDVKLIFVWDDLISKHVYSFI